MYKVSRVQKYKESSNTNTVYFFNTLQFFRDPTAHPVIECQHHRNCILVKTKL